MQIGSVKTSVDLDRELSAEVKRTAKLIKEKPAMVLRMAIRAGLPVVANRHQAPRPEGYFAKAYASRPKEQIELEEAFANQPVRLEDVWPERPGE